MRIVLRKTCSVRLKAAGFMQEQVECWVEGVSGKTLFAFVVLPDGNFLCRGSCGPVCGTARILRAAVTNAGIKGSAFTQSKICQILYYSAFVVHSFGFATSLPRLPLLFQLTFTLLPCTCQMPIKTSRLNITLYMPNQFICP